MDRPARRVDHGSSRLCSYRGTRPSGCRHEPLWVRAPVPSLLFLFGLQGRQKAKKINVLVARASSNVRASGYTFEKWHEGACRISHVVDMSASSELKAK